MLSERPLVEEALWAPAQEDLWYYAVKSPADAQSIFRSCVLEPALESIGLFKPNDLSYGRLQLPRSPDELLLRQEYDVQDRQVVTDLELKSRIRGSSTLTPLSDAPWSMSFHMLCFVSQGLFQSRIK
jgi:hypothetical protein